MRYLMQFVRPAHAFVYVAKHPGIIEPRPGVTDYVVDGDEPQAYGRVTISEYVEPATDQEG